MLTFEAWMWSIILISFVVRRYVNLCIVGSIIRVGWLPTLGLTLVYYTTVLSFFGLTMNDPIGALLLLFCVSLLFIGFASWSSLFMEPNSAHARYMSTKWLWKDK